MDERILDRLRASKARELPSRDDETRLIARRWAENVAEYAQLKALGELKVRRGDDIRPAFYKAAIGDSSTIIDQVQFNMALSEDGLDFRETDYPVFLDEVQTVWNEVKDKL